MKTSIEELTREALQLPPRQRVALAGFLLEIDQSSGDPGVDEVWENEIQARIKAVDSGSVTGIPHDDVIREADNRLNL
ncbi:addiction module protein [Oscillatoria amoena NRMC-F 0135]|uniref:Addiction module protein n=1 Tax=Geitlerinema calcuttense NRMC-F 0142 TaxID=2922238 RepID=A0ABT7M0W1_9CYAN|nr:MULTISPECIES: addiction module protein [Cyanophyceae]MDL5050386.1 addiction module protein [Oscillatoria amoena NRMC-F 0135]MDL5054217.1 addiction module protein [Oscillatoria laete-virens NRMC-F 0139]MDL5057467.1 addiction module protein [Geitlerinema calcuttense NRMC-F 0142]